MNFDGPVLAWLALALVPIVLPILLAVLLRHFLPIQTGCLPLGALCALGLISAFGIVAYLNAGGNVVKGEVLLKREFLVYHVDGSWNRKMVADISYSPSEGAPSTVKTLDLLPTRFDEISQGDFVELRIPAKPGTLRVVRLEDQKTGAQIWYWLTNQPFLFCFVLGLLLVLAVRFTWQTSLPTLFFLSGFVTIGAWWVASVGIPVWDQAGTLFGSLNSVGATVREVHPPYLGTGLQGWISTTLYRPTDLVLLDIIPVGHAEPILSIDEVDLGSVDLRPGQTVSAEYSAANPRISYVPDASRSFVWKNGLLDSILAGLALFGIAKFALVIRGKDEKPFFFESKRKKRNSVPAQ